MGMNIKKKIIISTVAISGFSILISMGCMMLESRDLGKEVLFSIAKDRLTSIRYFKTLQVESYFDHLMDNLSFLSTNQQLVNALQDFSKTFPKYLSEAKLLTSGYKTQVINNYLDDFSKKYKYYNIGKTIDTKKMLNLISENSFALQYNYIFNNPYSLANKEQLDAVKDGTTYSLMHAKYHQSLLAFKQQFGFYDLFLIDGKTGDIVYTVNKEIEYTTSLTNGPYAQSSVGEVFRSIMASGNTNFIAVADFAPYLAFYDNQAAFIGTAVFDDLGNKIGAVVAQLSVNDLNNIMTNGDQWEKIGLGKTVNTVIVGPDYKLRTSNRFFLENPKEFLDGLKKTGTDQDVIDLIKVKNSIIGVLKTDTLAVREAFSGKEGFVDYIDYRKIPVVSSFAPLKIPGLNWVMIVKINKNEALSWIEILNEKMLSSGIKIAIIVAIFAILLGIKTAGSIVKAIYKITDEINNIAKTKDLTKRLQVIENSEFTIMINAFNNFIANLQHTLKNIVDSSSKTQAKINHTSEDDVQAPYKQDIFDLNDQINDLSNEFKIIEDQNERSKYW